MAKRDEIRKLSGELARSSIVTKALQRYLEQITEEIYNSEIKPLTDALRKIADDPHRDGESRRIAREALTNN